MLVRIRAALPLSLSLSALMALLAPAGCGSNQESVDASVCASGTKWTGGDEESPKMHPGRDCIGCHTSKGEGPRFSLAGTLFGDRKQSDDCFGQADGEVVVTDATGKKVSMATNEAGNFYSSESVTFPITATVTYGGKTMSMVTPVGSGACNSCHTQSGANGAAGRIVFQLPGGRREEASPQGFVSPRAITHASASRMMSSMFDE